MNSIYKTNIILPIISGIVSILSFVTLRSTNLFGYISSNPDQVFTLSLGLSILIAFSGLNITLALSQNSLSNSVQNSIESLTSTVRDKFDTEIFRSTDQAHEYLSRQFPYASEVLNTTIRYGIVQYKEKFFSKFVIDQQKKVFKELLKNGKNWREIVSRNNFAWISTHVEIAKNLPPPPKFSLRIIEESSVLPCSFFC